MITAAQVRMARAGLRWSAQELADKAGVSWATIQRLEKDKDDAPLSRKTTLDAVASVLTAAGVEFIGADGVLLRRSR